MTTDKQIRANQLNSERSTGPRSVEGKAAVRYNAMTHGLLAQAAVLPDEDHALAKQLFDEIRDQLEPVGLVEGLLVDQIASCVWRLRRLVQVEAGLFIRELYDEAASRAHGEAQLYLNAAEPVSPGIAEVVSTSPRATDAEAYRAARERAKEAERTRDGSQGRVGVAFSRDAVGANAFTKLSRYETQIQRFLHQSLEKLVGLQQNRLLGVPSPRSLRSVEAG